MLRLAEFLGEFERVHCRKATPIETATIRNCAVLAAKVENRKIKVEVGCGTDN
jgi:hypothetical protein